MYGCGCWSQNGKDPSECSVAVSTSGRVVYTPQTLKLVYTILGRGISVKKCRERILIYGLLVISFIKCHTHLPLNL